MSFESLPSRSEVIGWSSTSLADYFKKMRLSGCDRVVMKNNMSGARFLNMSDKELKRFPAAHILFITKICKDINHNNKQKKGLFHRSEPLMPPKQEPNVGGWDSDEFDHEESESDYEEPDRNDCDDNYVTADQCHLEDNDDDDDYEPPPTEKPSDISSHLRPAQTLGDGDYIDSRPRGSSRPTNKSTSLPRALMNISKPPSRPDPSPNRPLPLFSRSKPGPALPMVDRSKKPDTSFFSKKDSNKSAKRHTMNITNNIPMASSLKALPTLKFNSQQTDFPPPPANFMMEQDMDPQWYMGQVKRGDAEVALREVNKDGTFLIRDSSKGCAEQPYTLMVLHQRKVYNIQIRFLGNKEGYSLGTGLKGIENFSSVMDMVTHHMRTPLILIDGIGRDAGPQRQCCLMYPAGF